MTVLELFNQAKDTLQDTDGNYWSESELLDYYNSGVRTLAAERLESPKTKVLNLVGSINEYTIDGVLRYISAKDSNNTVRPLYPDDTTGDEDLNGIIILDYNKIYVNNPETDVSVSIKHIAIPSDGNLTDTVRASDENALKYYMLSKAYEKESDLENFQKSQYFLQQFQRELNSVRKNSKVGYTEKTEITKGYYY
jgi:hypothetical protein